MLYIMRCGMPSTASRTQSLVCVRQAHMLPHHSIVKHARAHACPRGISDLCKDVLSAEGRICETR